MDTAVKCFCRLRLGWNHRAIGFDMPDSAAQLTHVRLHDRMFEDLVGVKRIDEVANAVSARLSALADPWTFLRNETSMTSIEARAAVKDAPVACRALRPGCFVAPFGSRMFIVRDVRKHLCMTYVNVSDRLHVGRQSSHGS